LDDGEVFKIAASISRYPIGGPDPLETAWRHVKQKGTAFRYQLFLELAYQLQSACPGQSIGLPLERTAELLDCQFALISRFRQRAVGEGRLTLVEPHVPHRRATLFVFHNAINPIPVQVSQLSSGLVVPPLVVQQQRNSQLALGWLQPETGSMHGEQQGETIRKGRIEQKSKPQFVPELDVNRNPQNGIYPKESCPT
jgi:hypothetical protein